LNELTISAIRFYFGLPLFECIFAGNFLREANDMNFYQKLERFEKLIGLNERVKTNSLHISLNFDASDQLDKDKLIAIATHYMERLGFANQPYLSNQRNRQKPANKSITFLFSLKTSRFFTEMTKIIPVAFYSHFTIELQSRSLG
jgi:hypothetical protein